MLSHFGYASNTGTLVDSSVSWTQFEKVPELAIGCIEIGTISLRAAPYVAALLETSLHDETNRILTHTDAVYKERVQDMGAYLRAVGVCARLATQLMMLFIALWLRFSVASARQRLETDNNNGM